MAKQFYTERDIVDMARSGVRSLEITDNTVLTELAYEKARALGITLEQTRPDNPPCAPIRPYLSKPRSPSCAETQHPGFAGHSPGSSDTSLVRKADEANIQERIRNAVVARLGNQVDANLLEVIIRRVLNSTGTKEQVCCSAESGARQSAPSNTPAPKD